MTSSSTSGPSTSHPTADQPDQSRGHTRLMRVFAVDRLLAATSAAVFLFGSPILADILDWPTWVVAAIGAGLAPYALLLHRIHSSGAVGSTDAKLTAVGDGLWVAGTALLLIGWPDATSTAGTWLLIAIAVVIADIGLLKLHGFTSLRRP